MDKMKNKTSQRSGQMNMFKRTALFVKRRPIVAGAVAVFVFALIGIGLYQAVGVTSSQIAKVGSKDASEKPVEAPVKKEVTQVDSIASSSPTPTPSASTVPQPAPVDKNSNPSSSNVAYNPNCRGAGCATPNPKYSIITEKSITVTAGSYVGPFKASTSTGVAVDWTGPQYDNGVGPYGYAQNLSDMRGTANYPFYIRAEANVAPGNYTLRIGSVDKATQSIVKTTINVTVLAAPAPPAMPY